MHEVGLLGGIERLHGGPELPRRAQHCAERAGVVYGGDEEQRLRLVR
jgi:hypothetical protein